MSTDFWIILTGALVAVSCSLLGCFLVLRKMAMVGDAISHAVLPGIVIAYLVSDSRASLPMLIGAVALGILTTFLIEFFHQKAKLQTDASIGVTFTWLFAVGVILLSLFAGQVDLDQECVLYGEIAYVPLNMLVTGSGTPVIPEAVFLMSLVLLIVLLFLAFGYKGFVLTTFDPAFAAVTGVAVGLWHYLLMGLVSLSTVAAFDSVGAILVVAFLIVPAATAYLLTDRLPAMLIISSLCGVLSSVLGYFLAASFDGSIAGGMAVMSGVLFLLAFLFSPTQGILLRRQRHRVAPEAAENSFG